MEEDLSIYSNGDMKVLQQLKRMKLWVVIIHAYIQNYNERTCIHLIGNPSNYSLYWPKRGTLLERNTFSLQ